MQKLLLILLMFCLPLFAAEVVSGDSVQVKNSERKSIPLPRQSAYIGEGLSVGLGIGLFDPTEECDCLFVWQGQGEFFYASWFSAGVDVRFFGGDLDSDVMVLNQRYRVNGKFHLSVSTFDFYIAPVYGLETTDLSEIRDEWDNRRDWGEEVEPDTLDEETVCEKLFSLDGFSMGLEGGFGWKFSRFVGVTSSVMYEYNFSRAQMLSTTHGLALDLREIWDFTKNSSKSLYLSFEGGFQRFFDRGVSSWAYSWILGLQLGI